MGVKRSDLELENHSRGEGVIVREPQRWYAAERQKSAATKYLIELPCAVDGRTVAGPRAQSPSTHIVPEKAVRRRNVVSDGSAATEVAATTRNSKWRHDAGVLGSLPFVQWGLWAPAPFRTNAVHAGLRVLLWWQLGRSLFGMPAREL